MQSVWIVHHVRPETDVHFEDVKLIGLYRTQSDGKAAIERLRHQPGFRDWPNDFTCEEYVLNEDHWAEDFAVQHHDVTAETVS